MMVLRCNRGFTLIEIMVVVVIIGILASLVVVNVTGRTDDARIKVARSNIEEIEAALELYRMERFEYPHTLEELEPKYLKRLHRDPWERPFLYENPGTHGEVDLVSLGADGRPGGEGPAADIANWDLR